MRKWPVNGEWASVQMGLGRRLGLGVATFRPFRAASAAEKIATIIDSIKFCTAYETGYYSADDVRRMGLAMLLLTIVVVSVTILYWGWLALLLTA